MLREYNISKKLLKHSSYNVSALLTHHSPVLSSVSSAVAPAGSVPLLLPCEVILDPGVVDKC